MSQAGIKHYIPHILGAIVLILIGILVWQNYTQSQEITTKSQEITSLQEDRNRFLNELNTTTSELSEANATIENLKEDLEDLADDYRDEKDRNEDFEDQIRDLAGTLGDLDKLAKTDEELLQKYSKVYFLNENYVPDRLKQIGDRYILEGKKDQYFHAKAIDRLEDLLDAARRAGHDIKVVSAYRSFDEQLDVKNGHTQVYGTGANAFSADQGYSEHQLGTTVDLTSLDVGGTFSSFAETEEYQWLLDNAHKHGFILSYPEGNTFYIFEPWHWRFVGEDLARDLERTDETFYDLDQREIDKYLLTIFD